MECVCGADRRGAPNVDAFGAVAEIHRRQRSWRTGWISRHVGSAINPNAHARNIFPPEEGDERAMAAANRQLRMFKPEWLGAKLCCICNKSSS